jgi:hypothetical protein
MEEFLEKINKNCNKDGLIVCGQQVKEYIKHEWTEDDVIFERTYCCTDILTSIRYTCRYCKALLSKSKFIIKRNMEIRAEKQRAEHEQAQKERHEEMLKAMSVLAIKQTYQMNQLKTLTTAVEALAPMQDEIEQLKKLPAAINSLYKMIETSHLLSSSTTSRSSSYEKSSPVDDYLRTYCGRSGYPRFK